MNLFNATKELHHACELHPLGQAMVDGTVTAQQWADWLGALHVLHSALDPHLPPYAQVSGELTMDLMDMLPIVPNSVFAAHDFARTLTSPANIGGAAYVLVGAHRRGGRVIEKCLQKAGLALPMRHVRFFAADDAEALLRWLRNKDQLIKPAQATFIAILDVMEEIIRHDCK
jgi:hypothetical protein